MSAYTEGPGSDQLTIDGNGVGPVSHAYRVGGSIADGGIKGLTITGGDAGTEPGGAIYVSWPSTVQFTLEDLVITGNRADKGGAVAVDWGNVVIEDRTITDNEATGAGGGAIYNEDGTLVIRNSTIADNHAELGFGGAIWNGAPWPTDSDLTLSGVTLTGNSARYGGAIYNDDGTSLLAENTTTANNAAGQFASGGGIYNKGMVTLRNVTISQNTAYDAGAGIHNRGNLSSTNTTITANRLAGPGAGAGIWIGGFTSTILHNTIVAGNVEADGTTPNDIDGDVDPASSHNLIGEGDHSTGLQNGVNGNIVGTVTEPVNPLLGPLANNGGIVSTHVPLSGSLAIETGCDQCAQDAEIVEDARGADRYFDADGDGVPTVDIGAVEVQWVGGRIRGRSGRT